MKIIRYIPISIFIWIATIYDIYSPKIDIVISNSSISNTRWSIFYFVIVYVAWLVHCMTEASKTNWFFFGGLSGVLLLRIILDLQKWWMDYEEYLISVTQFERQLLVISWTCITLISIIVHYGRKYKFN